MTLEETTRMVRLITVPDAMPACFWDGTHYRLVGECSVGLYPTAFIRDDPAGLSTWYLCSDVKTQVTGFTQ